MTTTSRAADWPTAPRDGGVITTIGRLVSKDPRFHKLVPQDAKIEVLAQDFEWTEGPVWLPDEQAVLFSDIPRNAIFRWKAGEGLSLFMRPSGYTGTEPWGPEPGTNGLMLDLQGRLVMCEHGNRRVTRLDRPQDCIKTVLASHYEGKRLNSPNDLVFNRRGDLYFTDPPYGLPNRWDDPRRELDFCGVYRLTPDGTLTLLTQELARPNGIALSPDEKTLYVAQSDPERAIWMAFPVRADGTLDKGRLLHDATSMVGKAPGLPDGMCVDEQGYIFATGPGGVWVFAPDGTHLGTIETGQRTANCTFGGADGSTLFVAADMYFCRVQTTTRGLRLPKQP
jgi:gluconolactonase